VVHVHRMPKCLGIKIDECVLVCCVGLMTNNYVPVEFFVCR
jgi:hypothetical protein